jgi:hypothetical protein
MSKLTRHNPAAGCSVTSTVLPSPPFRGIVLARPIVPRTRTPSATRVARSCVAPLTLLERSTTRDRRAEVAPSRDNAEDGEPPIAGTDLARIRRAARCSRSRREEGAFSPGIAPFPSRDGPDPAPRSLSSHTSAAPHPRALGRLCAADTSSTVITVIAVLACGQPVNGATPATRMHSSVVGGARHCHPTTFTPHPRRTPESSAAKSRTRSTRSPAIPSPTTPASPA